MLAHVFGLFIIVLLSFPLPAQTRSCKSLHLVLSEPQIQLGVDEVLGSSGFLSSEFRSLFHTSTRDPLANAEILSRRLSQWIASLNKQDLKELRERSEKATEVFHQFFREEQQNELRILRLALGSPDAIKDWRQKLIETDSDKTDLKATALFLRAWSPQLAESTAIDVLKQIPQSRKLYLLNTELLDRDHRYPPHRALSYVSKVLLLDPEKLLLRAKEVSGRKAYAEFLENRQNKVKNLGFGLGNFSSELIQAVIFEIQTELKTYVTNKNLDPQDQTLQITLDGSFFNGLAQKGISDIDLFYNHPGLKNFIEKSNLRSRLSRLFQKVGFEKMPLELQDVAEQLPEAFRQRPEAAVKIAEMGAVSFTVLPNTVTMNVFPSTATRKESIPF